MDIHQMQVRYDPTADRLLWHLRTQGGELFSAWLTRRMVRAMWPPFLDLVAQAGLPRAVRPPAGQTPAGLMPEAREMLAEAARTRPLPGALFDQPFNAQPAAQPLGPEPMLPVAIDLGPGQPAPGLSLRLRDARGRSLAMQLNADLASALLRLMERAVAESDWGLQLAPPAAAATGTGPARILN